MRYLVVILLVIGLGISSEGIANGLPNISADTVIVKVKGTATDARFEPATVKINPADVIRFVVEEGLHTVTAYHPDNRRPLRMPASAESFDSGLLQKGDVWNLQINTNGVYDYFCLPHEKMGHAGRIISGTVESIPEYPTDRIPVAVLKKINTD